jgi:hypothetical protein
MRIKDASLGAVVCNTEIYDEPLTSADIGHVVGFELNPINELCISVKFADGSTRLRHPNMVQLYEL